MSEFKLKNTIGEGTKIFWKYQLTVWLSIQNLYLHFTKVTRKWVFWSHCRALWCHNATFFVLHQHMELVSYSLCQKHFDKLARTAFLKICFYLVKQILCNFYKSEQIFTTLEHRASGFWPRLFLADQLSMI